MTYHHLNRFKAHNKAKINLSERLIAWHFASESRERNGTYSESIRRLEEALELDPKTIRRGLARLVDLGLFERIDRTGTHAPIYRLLVSCPFSCEDLESHNTKQELAVIWERNTLPLPNTPTLKGNHAPPYIEIEREEEGETLFQIGAKELGWIIGSLKALTELNTDQANLLRLATEHPKALSKAALDLLPNHLEEDRRKRAYLKEVATNDPRSLLDRIEDHLAGEDAKELILNSREETNFAFTSDLKPEYTRQRLNDYAATAIHGWKPSNIVSGYLTGLALDNLLTPNEVARAYLFEQAITKQGLNGFIETTATPENSPLYLNWVFGSVSIGGTTRGLLRSGADLDYLYSPEEFIELTNHREGLKTLAAKWEAKHGAISLNKFFMDTDTRAFLQLHPDPLTDLQKEERLKLFWYEIFSSVISSEATKKLYEEDLAHLPNFDTWLELNYSIEEDFNLFLHNYPEREFGSNTKNKKQAFKAWLAAREFYSNEALVSEAGRYWDRTENLAYAKLPQNWLNDLVAEKVKH
jgi:hypothetical protein